VKRAPVPTVTHVQRARQYTPRENPATLYVYVVELDPEAARKVHQEPNGPALYIGQSGNDPRYRFEQHLRGGMFAADVVKRFGVRLLATFGPFADRDTAEKVERETAQRLKGEGWITFGGISRQHAR